MIAAPARFVVDTIVSALGSVRRWPVRAQLHARRNAMVAATSCTARRAASDDVLAWFDERDAPAVRSDPAPVRQAR